MKIKLSALILSLAACGTLLAQQPPASPPPGPPPPAPEPVTAVVSETGGTNDVVPLIVIDEVPLTDAIRNLARQSALNFQFDPRITMGPDGQPTNQPNVSIRFENVTAQEALNAVLDNYNLTLVKDPRSKIARISIKDPAAPDPLVAKIIQLKYSDPTNLVALIKSTLSARSQVAADNRTSQILVTATEAEMTSVIELVETLDTPTKQVLIEANLLETSRAPSSIKGIDWSGTLEAQRLAFGNNAGTPAGAPGLNNVLVGSTPGKLLLDTARGFNPNTAFLDADGVSAVLSFLNKDAETEVVATPRAVTLDNQKAVLAVTRAFPVFKVTPGSANSPAGAEITYTNLGTILEVTPRIAADDNISLRVVPEVSNIDSIDRQVLNGQANTANIYAIRRIEANVMIPSGSTLVMGGMINDRSTKQYIKVPVLGDLPGVGGMFRQNKKTRDKSNLLIFITPTIVEAEDFHVSSTGPEFLQSRLNTAPEPTPTAWDSARPHDWTKPVY